MLTFNIINQLFKNYLSNFNDHKCFLDHIEHIDNHKPNELQLIYNILKQITAYSKGRKVSLLFSEATYFNIHKSLELNEKYIDFIYNVSIFDKHSQKILDDNRSIVGTFIFEHIQFIYYCATLPNQQIATIRLFTIDELTEDAKNIMLNYN